MERVGVVELVPTGRVQGVGLDGVRRRKACVLGDLAGAETMMGVVVDGPGEADFVLGGALWTTVASLTGGLVGLTEFLVDLSLDLTLDLTLVLTLGPGRVLSFLALDAVTASLDFRFAGTCSGMSSCQWVECCKDHSSKSPYSGHYY